MTFFYALEVTKYKFYPLRFHKALDVNFLNPPMIVLSDCKQTETIEAIKHGAGMWYLKVE